MNYVERSEEIISDDGFLQRVHETVFIGLRKCPKCGAKAKSKPLNIEDLSVDVRADYIDAGDDFYIVKCTNPKCNCKTKPCTTLEEAVNIWNNAPRE